jgi:transcriptional regulator with XRE-family HTH domain
MSQLKEIVARRLSETGMNPFEAARRGGLERSFVNDILIGKKLSIRADKANQLAAALDLPVGAIVASGAVSAASSVAIPVMGRVGAGAKVEFSDDEAELAISEAIAFPGGLRIGALVVQGDSQYPRFRNGEVVLFERKLIPIEDLVGEFAILDSLDGRRLLKIPRRGAGETWNLESANAPVEEGVALHAQGYRIVGTLLRRTPDAPPVKEPPKPAKRERRK